MREGSGTTYASIARYEGDHYLAMIDKGANKPFVRMDDPMIREYLVKDVGDSLFGSWRWTGDRPELRFDLTKTENLALEVDFSVAGATLKDTGPVTLSFLVNDQSVGTMRIAREGDYKFWRPVSGRRLDANGTNRIAVSVNPVWVAPRDGKHLGFILSAAGFVSAPATSRGQPDRASNIMPRTESAPADRTSLR
jgi:hypothetical protein